MNNIGDDLARAYEDGYNNGYRDGMEKAHERIDEAPTIDPVRHARWVGKYKSTCSECGDVNIRAFAGPVPRYCQVCGARMDGEE